MIIKDKIELKIKGKCVDEFWVLFLEKIGNKSENKGRMME
jgi:hypothetical protein